MARLVLFLLLAFAVICVAVVATYWFLDRKEQRRLEREREQDDLTERLVEEAEREYNERERGR